MKKLVIIFLLGFMTLSFGAFARMRINSNGKISVDADSPESSFRFEIIGDHISKIYVFNSTVSSSQNILEACQTHLDKMLSIDNVTLIPVLVQAIKEQQAQIDELKKRINK
ncbi:MAG: hypothetical protein K0M40_13945 [Prolixibacteraceae bacterium]|nr:hypothetical protein [Prolixibacteraceae bacterium]